MNGARLNRLLSRNSATGPGFLGVYSIDQLPPRKAIWSYPASMVINLDRAKGPGTHWVGLYLPNAHEASYFDSFGEPPPLRVLAWLGANTQVEFNPFVIQSLISDVCGHYVAYFLHASSKGQDFEDLLVKLASNNSDHYVLKYLSKLLWVK